MWFTVNKFDHGCCGRKYPTMLDAIKDDAWSPWNEERVRKAHNLGRGTMKDHYRHNLMNAKVIVTESEFWNMTACLGDEWRAMAEEFIKRVLS